MLIQNAVRFITLTLFLFAICSCWKSDDSKQSKPDFPIEKLEQAGWIYQFAPNDSVAYMRIPTLWGFFSAREDQLKYAQGNPHYVEQVRKLKAATIETLSAQLPPSTLPFVLLFGDHLQSPLEILVTAKPNNPMSANLFGSATLNFTTSEFQEFFNQLAESNPMVTVVEAMDEQNSGLLRIGPSSFVYQYNDKKQFNFLMGMGLGKKYLAEKIESLKQPASKSFTDMVNAIDDGGQGYVLWLNSGEVMSNVAAFMPAEDMPFKEALTEGSIKSVAMGFGTSNNKGRLRLAMEVPASSQISPYLPNVNTELTLKAVGDPTLVAQLNAPMLSQVEKILDAIESMDEGTNSEASESEQSTEQPNAENTEIAESKSIKQQYEAFKKDMSDIVGFDLEQLMAAYGPEITVFSDEAGMFAALKIQDKSQHALVSKALKGLIEKLNNGTANLPIDDAEEKAKAEKYLQSTLFETRSVESISIHHLSFPSFYDLIKEQKDFLAGSEIPPFAMDLLMGGRSHLYWTEEDNYLIFSTLPQNLMQRHAAKKNESIQSWLQKNGLLQNGSLLSLSGKVSDSPKNAYIMYLKALQSFSDSLNAELDMFSFPPASALALNGDGIYSFQIDSANEMLAFELTYEKSPAEILFAGQTGMIAVATVGILAAVAIPAYQDYILRADTAEVLLEASTVKRQLLEFYAENQRLPNANELAQFDVSSSNELIESIQIVPETSEIIVRLQGKPQLQGKIFLTPEVTEYGLEFYCSSDITEKYLPSTCRDYY